MKNKGNSLKKIKLMLGLLVLIGGLVVGIELVQTNQENRSKAAYIKGIETGDSTRVIDYKKGSWPYPGWSPPGESKCASTGGICAKFSSIWSDGTPCLVGKKYGYINKKILCSGDDYVLCCSPKKPCSVDGKVYSDSSTFCVGNSTRVYVCDNGNKVHRGLDCSTKGKICKNGECVNRF